MKIHIRKRLPRKGGNQFYKDNTLRVASTICGDAVTAFDLAWNDSTTDAEMSKAGIVAAICPKCKEERPKLYGARFA